MDGEADRQAVLFERYQELIAEEQLVTPSKRSARRSRAEPQQPAEPQQRPASPRPRLVAYLEDKT